MSKAFPVSSGVKQGCILASTLFGIFFSMLLQYTFKDCNEGVYIHIRADGKLFNIARLCAKTKVTHVLIRGMLFVDDAALTSHTEDSLQQLVSRLSHACKEFSLTISIKKTNVMAKDSDHPPTISIDGHTLEDVENFTCLRSAISSTLNIEVEVNNRIAKAAAAITSRLTKRVWNNSSLTEKTRLRVFQACVLSTFLYGSETWTTYAKKEKKLNSFHMRCLRCILHIHWEEKVPDTEVRERANRNSMLAMLRERCLRWLGHVKRMQLCHINKDILYGELTEGKRKAGRPLLRFKDTCKTDVKLCGIDIGTWEKQANDRPAWRLAMKKGVRVAEENRRATAVQKRQKKPAIQPIPPCLHRVQQRLQIAGRLLQPLAQLSTTVMLYHHLSQADGSGQLFPSKTARSGNHFIVILHYFLYCKSVVFLSQKWIIKVIIFI